MSEVLLDRSEVIFLLHVIQARAIVGIPAETLFPSDPVEQQQLIAAGEEKLLRRGLVLVGSNGLRMIEGTLCAMVTAIADPDLATVAIRHVAGAGQQIFLLYQSANLAVEQTFPSEGTHRLALLGSPAALLERLQVILPIRASAAKADGGVMPQNTFVEMQHLVHAGQWQRIGHLLRESGLSEWTADALLRAMEHPDLDGTVALMRCQRDSIADARNVAILCGAETAWAFHQLVPGELSIAVEPATADSVRNLLVRWRDELMVAA
jgi:hypothetical protein